MRQIRDNSSILHTLIIKYINKLVVELHSCNLSDDD